MLTNAQIAAVTSANATCSAYTLSKLPKLLKRLLRVHAAARA